MATTRSVFVVPHTHWDREWHLPFQTLRARLVTVVDALLDLLEAEESLAFTLDGQLATVDDYLEVRPDAEPRIRALVAQGRLAVGPWQTLLDEFCVSGETIVRNLERGWRRGEELGGAMAVGYLPDMFGHVAQMPQILRRAGLRRAVVWRGVPADVDRHAFEWVAADGSCVQAEYLIGGYGNAAFLFDLPDRVESKVAALHRQLAPFFGDDDLLAMVGADHLAPHDAAAGLVAAVNDAQDHYRLRVTTLDGYLAEAARDASRPPRCHGELRSGARANLLMGVTSARVDGKAACARAERLLERYAEPLSALHDPPAAATADLLDLAWRRVVDNAAHDSVCGCSADAVAAQVLVRYGEAEQIAREVTAQTAAALARRVPVGAHVVVNASPVDRDDLVELDMVVAPEWGDVAVRLDDGTTLATQEEARVAPLLLGETMRGDEASHVFDRMHGRELFGRLLNGVRVERRDGRHRLTFEVDEEADPAFLDVDELRVEVETALGVAPDEPWEVRIVGRPRRRLLARVPAPALGAAVVTPVRGGHGCADPVHVAARRLHSDLLQVGVAADGTLSLQADGAELHGVGRLVDGGDAGDSYNWAPPETDLRVAEPLDVAVRVTARGPLRGALAVERTYAWPRGLAADGRARSAARVPVTVTTHVELRAGEAFTRLRVVFDNACDDHRLRWHLPLPAPAERSWAEGQFAVVERGLVADGGHGEHPLPTFPARGFVAVDGVAVLLEHLTEYEIVDGGSELALTLLRSVGLLSRNVHPLRTEPAGPELAIPGAQLHGRRAAAFALYPFSGHWEDAGVLSAMERYQHPFVTVPGTATATAAARDRARTAGLRIDGDNVVLSALRRRGEWLELRVVCQQARAATCAISGGVVAARDADLLGRPGGPLPVADGTLRLGLGPWEIRTVQLSTSWRS